MLTSEENKGTTVTLNLPVGSPEQMSVDVLSEPVASEQETALVEAETAVSASSSACRDSQP